MDVKIVLIFLLHVPFQQIFGLSDDKGIVMGVWNNASFITTSGIPDSDPVQFNDLRFNLSPSKTRITSISPGPGRSLYFSAERGIYEIINYNIWNNETFTISSVYQGKSNWVGQIAMDVLSNNIYWCDGLFHWIAMKPLAVTNTTRLTYRVLIDRDLHQPEGLALDPQDGLMFFTENYPRCRIERASMTGDNRTVLVYSGLIRVMCLSLDTVEDWVFWADYERQTVETCGYDGSNRRVLRRMNGVPLTDLHFYENVIHGVSARKRTLVGIGANTGDIVYSTAVSAGDPYAVTVFNAAANTSNMDPCSLIQCQQICVNTPSGPTCLCGEGFSLQADGLSCKERSWFHDKGLILNNATMFYMLDTRFINGQGGRIPYFMLKSSIITTFTVDAYSRLIYFADAKTNSIYELNIFTQRYRLIAPAAPSADLTYDWMTNSLVWIEPDQSLIRTFSLVTGQTSTVYSNLQQPTALTIDAQNGYIFWISRTASAIQQGSWDRLPPRVVLSSLTNPRHLYYDVSSQRLFWLENGLFIKSCLITGTDVKSHVIAFNATNIFVYKGYLGWLSGNQIHFAKQTSVASEVTFNIFATPREITVFDPLLQRNLQGTCQILNGGCDDICIPTSGGSECKCDAGLQLQSDSKTCGSNVKNDDFVLVTDFSHGRILQIDMVTGELSRLPPTIQKCTGLSLDESSQELLYSDQALNTIQSYSLLTKNTTVLYTTGFYFAERLAVDSSTGHLYFTAVSAQTNVNASYIGVIHRSLRLHKTLIPNLQNPRAIALYPSKGMLFWTEIGAVPGIGRSHMDGTSREYIVSRNVSAPNGLAIDYKSDRLYWTDGEKNQIESSDLDGGNRQVLTSDPGALMMDIVISGQFLFYTAWNRQSVIKVDKTTGLKVPFMANHPELGRLDSLDVFADSFLDVSKTCSEGRGQCSTFCFPTPNGGICGCQDNVSLLPNNKTCVGAPRCTLDHPRLDLLDCDGFPGLPCQFQCGPGLTPTHNTTLTCTPGGQWSVNPETLCPVAADEFTNEGQPSIFEKYSLYIYIGGGCTLLVVVVIVSLLLRRFVCRHKTKEPPRLHYENSVASETNPYSAFMNRGYENSCMERPSSGEYNTIAEMMMYEDMKAPGGTTDPQHPYLRPCDDQNKDTYFIPCTDHTDSPYLKAI